jgi:protein-tyrosine phosphatase
VGILSHPERNQGLLADPAPIARLVDAGCLMQVTAGSLLGAFGPACERFSQSLLEQGLVHFISSDGHGVKSRRPLLRDAWRRVAELVDEETASDLCCRNPACVVAGKTVAPGRRGVKRRRWNNLIPWRRSA